jgi:glycosyltransferase involved in cell wall biosynthesis
MIIGAGTHVRFICDFAPGFTGAAYRTRGVGGTDALVVLMAEELVRRGAAVTVETPGPADTSNGVAYRTLDVSQTGREAHVTVLVKQWSDAVASASGIHVFLAPDVHVNPSAQIDRCRAWCHVAFAGSDFNRVGIERVIGPGRIETLGWPVETDAYTRAGDTRENLLIYCSVPDRGLYHLQYLFPKIRRRVPDARLLITSDFSLWGLSPARDAFLKFFDGFPGVEYAGHVDRPALVAAQMRAKVLAYPCTFPEGFCLAAAECMAAGTVPVTTRAYALTTTVGDAGVLIPGHPRRWLYRRRFVSAVVRLLENPGEWLARSSACRAAARDRFTPARVIDDFSRAVSRIAEGRVP